VSDDAPRLRAVEAFPIDHGGQRCIALRDPAGYTEAVLVLPLPLVEWLALLDGQRGVVDIQAELTRQYGTIVPRAEIEEVIATLDEHGFMDSPRFAELRARIDGEFLAGPMRPAVHAGSAYAAGADELRAAMDGFFSPPAGPGPVGGGARAAGPPRGRAGRGGDAGVRRGRRGTRGGGGEPAVRGLIAPHIDFHRGGPAYAWGYRDLAERCDADLFVVLGTCHAGMPDPFAVTAKAYDTPFGPAPVDRDFVEALARRARQDCFGSELAHRKEHSIEFQAVFLRYLYAGSRDVAIVPVLTSFAHECLARGQRPADDPRVPRFLDALAETIAASGRRVALIAGADLAHVGPRFGDGAPVSPEQQQVIEREDRAMLEAVTAGEAEAFFDAVAADGDRRRICGYSPIYALLKALDGAPGTLRRYGQWPDPQGLVSFASVVF
jgi:AmmeMemoRadiSam system protein B